MTFGADVWHYPFTVLDRPARFPIFLWKGGTSADDECVQVAPFEVVLL